MLPSKGLMTQRAGSTFAKCQITEEPTMLRLSFPLWPPPLGSILEDQTPWLSLRQEDWKKKAGKKTGSPTGLLPSLVSRPKNSNMLEKERDSR